MVFFGLVGIEHDLTPIVIGIFVIGGAVIVQFIQGMYPMAVWGGMLVLAFNVTSVGSQAWFAGAAVVTISIITLIVTRRSATYLDGEMSTAMPNHIENRLDASVENKTSKPAKVSHSTDDEPYNVIYERQLIENIDVQEAAKRYEVSEATIRKWLNEGELEGYKDENRWIIPVYSDEILSVQEASKTFGVSPAKIRNWLNEDLIAGYKDERNRWCIYAPDE